jgi:2-hydroxy-4-carboxymuconate semialdehyde hemiacetal dehydrogenase
MTGRLRVCMAGEGAIARQHLDAMAGIEEIDVVSLAGGREEETAALADARGFPMWSLDLAEVMERSTAEDVVLASPSPLHAAQAVAVIEAGRHVLIEIPMALSLLDATAVESAQRRHDVVAMVCHTRRFNPPHAWIRRRVEAAELTVQHLVVETMFFRRENRNALGAPRDWTDHLLWHHACHTVDLFAHQTGGQADSVWAQQGPIHPELGIAMDMTVGLRAAGTGALCTLALSFNHDGPFGTTFRYVCDRGTYVVVGDDLFDGSGRPLEIDEDGAASGIERQDREFAAAALIGRSPLSSVRDCVPTMRTIDRLAGVLADQPALMAQRT